MNPSPEIDSAGERSSSGARSSSGGVAFAAPFVPLFGSGRMPAVGGDTVLNTDGRRAAAADESSDTDMPSAASSVTPADSDVQRRLFPGEPTPDAPADGEATVGCDLGHFTIDERIGAGGMGAVFRALDRRLERVVALKVLSPTQSRDRAAVLRFENEARAAARLDHENIARVHYTGEDRGLYFIAFEYVTGQNVRDLIAQAGRLTIAESVNYAVQIATALRHTAAAGVVHRDIKPSNVIIMPNGRAKLVDLGLARKLATEAGDDLTVVGTTLGTFDYISPEQARDPRTVDVRSDIYSLGCTLYHMLTGVPPHSRGTVLQKLLDRQSKDAPDPREIVPQISPGLAGVCRKMMAGDPKARYSTPDELLRDLAKVAASLGLRPLPAEGPVWLRPASHQPPAIRTGLIWAGSAAAVVLLALLADRLPTGERTKPAVRLAEANAPAEGDGVAEEPGVLDTAATAGPIETVQPAIASAADVRRRAVGTGAAAGVAEPDRLPATEPKTTRPAGTAVASNDAPAGRPFPDPNRPSVPPRPSDIPFDFQEFLPRSLLEPFAWAAPSGRTPAGASEELKPPATDSGADLGPWDGADDGSSAVASADSSRAAEAEAAAAETLPIAVDVESPIVLNSASAEHQVYPSLAAAVRDAVDGDTIELRFDGALRGPDGGVRATERLRIDRKSITIKAGLGADGRLCRPLVAFDASAFAPSERAAIVVAGGGLAVENVDLRMTVRGGRAGGGADRWALFALPGGESVRLSGANVTLVNPESRPMTVFDLRPPADVSARMAQMIDPDGGDGFGIAVEQCLVRGEADLVTIASTLPGRISLAESAVALRSALLNVTGGTEQPLADEAVELDLDRVTVAVGDGLLRMEVGGSEVTPVRVTATESVFASMATGPLVLMSGYGSADRLVKSLDWSGRRNVYDQFTPFWSIVTADGPVDAAADYRKWAEHWGLPDAATEEIRWAAPDWRVKKLAELTGDDLAVDPIGPDGVIDGRGIGVPAEELPARADAPRRVGLVIPRSLRSLRE